MSEAEMKCLFHRCNHCDGGIFTVFILYSCRDVSLLLILHRGTDKLLYLCQTSYINSLVVDTPGDSTKLSKWLKLAHKIPVLVRCYHYEDDNMLLSYSTCFIGHRIDVFYNVFMSPSVNPYLPRNMYILMTEIQSPLDQLKTNVETSMQHRTRICVIPSSLSRKWIKNELGIACL
ncbi:Uncharacterized protein APZ42_018463 [Daphnia magna]|uniref:Uncharacterized protein n=1 Tax=Daphnia magna TaxID=35525 RepID=A0A164Z334_9CRUS|nr:Uncharacterized protein APZ42_018463 [Daphnia magna]